MAKAVFLGAPHLGHTNPSLGLIRELTDRGEQVSYFSYEIFRPKIEHAGAVFRSYREAQPDPATDNKKLPDPQDWVEYLAAGFGNTLTICERMVKSNLAAITAEKPQYLICDSMEIWGKHIARLLKIPLVTSITLVAYHPRMLDLDPHYVMKYVFRLPDNAAVNVKSFRKTLDILARTMCREHSLAGIEDSDLLCSKGDLNIVYTSKSFQPYADCFDASYQFVGPAIHPQINYESAGFSLEPVKNQAVILISLGTIFNQRPDFYKTCFTAFKDLKMTVILAIGANVPVAELGTIPDNFIVRPVVPQVEILKYARLFVTHGGMNSISEALYFRVPMIVLPQAVDQFMNAERIETLGVGIWLKAREDTVIHLKEAAEKIVTDHSYYENCGKISASFKVAGGYQRAVEEIFRLKETK